MIPVVYRPSFHFLDCWPLSSTNWRAYVQDSGALNRLISHKMVLYGHIMLLCSQIRPATLSVKVMLVKNKTKSAMGNNIVAFHDNYGLQE